MKIVFLFFIIFNFTLFAQESETDLRMALIGSKDTSLINAYLELGRFYYQTTGSGDSLLKYGLLGSDLAKKINHQEKQLESSVAIATAYLINGEMELAETRFYQAIDLAGRLKNLKSLADIHNKLGVLYYNSEQPEKAISHMILSAEYSEKIKDYEKLCYAYYGISSVYVYLDQNEKRLSYIYKALKLIYEHPEITAVTQEIIYSSAAQHYLEVADSSSKYIDSAYYFAKTGLEIASKNNFNGRKPTYYNIISDYFFRKNNFKESQVYIDSALVLTSYLRPDTKLILYLRLASIYSTQDKKQQAYNYLDSIRQMSILDEHYYNMKYSSTAYTIYKKFGNDAEALKALESKLKHESILKEKQREQLINELDKKYQTDLKDAEILRLNQQQQIDALQLENNDSRIRWLVGLVIISILAILIVLFIFRQARVNNRLKMMETEQRLNRARINPHFFFNAMASLQNFSYQENSPKTSQFISRFAKIMRQSLESTYSELISIEQEIDFLTQYLEVQKLRFPEKFDYMFTIDESLEINELKIPGMILQPFVENSIEHGFANLDRQGKIEIKFLDKSDKIEIQIFDNGKGTNAHQKSVGNTSRAMQIIRDRLYIFNKQQHSKADYFVITDKTKSGFEIIIHLPKIYSTNENSNHR